MSKQRFDYGLGPHLILECLECSKEKLSDPSLISGALDKFPDRIGMKKISAPYVFSFLSGQKSGPGVSGVVLITESHVSVHTFPDERKALIDVFSCKEFDINAAVTYMTELFGAADHKAEVFSRGFQFLGDLGRTSEALAGEVKR